MIVGGKREKKAGISSEISFFPPCCENCDWKLRNDLKHIRFSLEMLTVAVVRKIKLPTARLAGGRTVKTFCSNLEISYATGGWRGKYSKRYLVSRSSRIY